MKKYSGYFITLEGGEGCGKTCQIPSIVESLRQKGLKVYATREPGGNFIGEQIREVLHNKKNVDMHPRTETLLYQAARAQFVERTLLPILEEGLIVISDRYSDSTKAYQGYGRQRDMREISMLIEYATGGLTPDFTVLIDLDPKIGDERKKANGSEINRMDLLPPEFYERVRVGYLKMAKEEPNRWVIIDGNQSKELVFADLSREIENRLALSGFLESDRRSVER
jgi:dTMP kinase